MPTPCILRDALTKFAPVGFHSMLADRAIDNHPFHDRFYDGGFNQTINGPRGPTVVTLPLFSLAKRQFEPVLEKDLKPITATEQELRMHMKKHTCK